MFRRNKVRRNKNLPKFGKTAEFGARRKNHLYGTSSSLPVRSKMSFDWFSADLNESVSYNGTIA
jgi:hypothetical protein